VADQKDCVSQPPCPDSFFKSGQLREKKSIRVYISSIMGLELHKETLFDLQELFFPLHQTVFQSNLTEVHWPSANYPLLTDEHNRKTNGFLNRWALWDATFQLAVSVNKLMIKIEPVQ
jgi:hypothetical protein